VLDQIEPLYSSPGFAGCDPQHQAGREPCPAPAPGERGRGVTPVGGGNLDASTILTDQLQKINYLFIISE
jgi:hypothetical protein